MVGVLSVSARVRQPPTAHNRGLCCRNVLCCERSAAVQANYLQVSTTMTSFNTPWPPILTGLWGLCGAISSLPVNSSFFQCSVGFTFYGRVRLAILSPFIPIPLVALVYIVPTLVRRWIAVVRGHSGKTAGEASRTPASASTPANALSVNPSSVTMNPMMNRRLSQLHAMRAAAARTPELAIATAAPRPKLLPWLKEQLSPTGTIIYTYQVSRVSALTADGEECLRTVCCVFASPNQLQVCALGAAHLHVPRRIRRPPCW